VATSHTIILAQLGAGSTDEALPQLKKSPACRLFDNAQVARSGRTAAIQRLFDCKGHDYAVRHGLKILAEGVSPCSPEKAQNFQIDIFLPTIQPPLASTPRGYIGEVCATVIDAQ
jgi:hypothetical protein